MIRVTCYIVRVHDKPKIPAHLSSSRSMHNASSCLTEDVNNELRIILQAMNASTRLRRMPHLNVMSWAAGPDSMEETLLRTWRLSVLADEFDYVRDLPLRIRDAGGGSSSGTDQVHSTATYSNRSFGPLSLSVSISQCLYVSCIPLPSFLR